MVMYSTAAVYKRQHSVIEQATETKATLSSTWKRMERMDDIELTPLGGAAGCSSEEPQQDSCQDEKAPAKGIMKRLSNLLAILAAENNESDPFGVKAVQEVEDWIVSAFIGFLVVTYWRGTWTLMDIWGCNQPQNATLIDGNTFCFASEAATSARDKRVKSAIIAYVCGVLLTILGVAMLWTGWWHPRPSSDGKVCSRIRKRHMIARVLIVYSLGMAAVCQWRGIWYLTDELLSGLPMTDGSFSHGLQMPLASWWLSCGLGFAGTILMCCMASLLAPPAIFLLDGPSVNPPPIGVTALSSYFSLTAPFDDCLRELPTPVEIIDAVGSFIVLPWFVVWFWRGCWQLCDYYLWRFSPDARDLHDSLGFSTAIAVICYGLTCETTMSLLKPTAGVAGEVLGRTRTFLLALGTVNFWRVVWYLWDEFLPGPTTLSCALSHAGAFLILLSIGCVSSILAPPSTLGVDAVPHPDCAEEPLFGMLPITTPTLYFFAIGREPLQTLKDQEICKEKVESVSLRETSFLEMQRPNLARRPSRRHLPLPARLPTERPPLMRQASMRLLVRPVLKRRESFYFRNR